MKVTDEMREEARGTAKHNKYCETVFAFFNQMLRTHPNISTLSAEASLMFTFNKTAEWLQAKDEEEEHKILKESRRAVTRVVRAFKTRQDALKQQKAQLLLLSELCQEEDPVMRPTLENILEIINKEVSYSLYILTSQRSMSRTTSNMDTFLPKCFFVKQVKPLKARYLHKDWC